MLLFGGPKVSIKEQKLYIQIIYFYICYIFGLYIILFHIPESVINVATSNNPDMLNFRQIQVFAAVYEAGSLSKAAERINATQPGLSVQLRELEATLGVKLFDRTPKGVCPTQAGSRFYRQATDILRALNAAESSVKRLSEAVSGHIRVGLISAFTSGILVPTLKTFIEQYPDVEINILEAYSPALTAEVARGGLDFAIVPSEPVSEGMNSSYFGSDWELLISGSGSNLNHLAPVDLAQLPPLKLVLPTRGNARRDHLDTFFALHHLPIESVLELDAMIATLNFVASTNWMTIVPATICAGDINGETRKLHPIRTPHIHVDYMVIQPRQKILSPAARLFLNALHQEFEATHQQWDQILDRPGPLPATKHAR